MYIYQYVLLFVTLISIRLFNYYSPRTQSFRCALVMCKQKYIFYGSPSHGGVCTILYYYFIIIIIYRYIFGYRHRRCVLLLRDVDNSQFVDVYLARGNAVIYICVHAHQCHGYIDFDFHSTKKKTISDTLCIYIYILYNDNRLNSSCPASYILAPFDIVYAKPSLLSLYNIHLQIVH